jgi:hypothetical protein
MKIKDFMEYKEWNNNINFLDRIDKRFDEANEFAGQGLYLPWLRKLLTIYSIMHHEIITDNDYKFNKKQDTKIDEWLSKHFKLADDGIKDLASKMGTDKFSNVQMKIIKREEVEETLHKIDIVLSDLYVKYFIKLKGKKQDVMEPEEYWD